MRFVTGHAEMDLPGDHGAASARDHWWLPGKLLTLPSALPLTAQRNELGHDIPADLLYLRQCLRRRLRQ